jgi:Do/DeqQ family serine protease
MKNIVLLIFAAVFGGLTALVVEKKFYTQTESNQLKEYKVTAPVTFTSASSHPAGSIDFTNAAEASINAVVHVKTTTQEITNNLTYDPFHMFYFNQPKQRIQQSSGSGVIISKDGYIATNNHVINGASKIEVVLNDKRTYTAELIGADPQTDVALLKIKETDLPYLSYGNSDLVKVGEWALAVGNPFNLTSTVTAGIISAKGRNINIFENDPASGLFPIESFIQTDAAVNPGNSGGALVNTNGELIGINTAIASQTGSYAGYAFAIPVNIVRKIIADLIEFGTVQRAFIGISIRDIDAKFAKDQKLNALNGVYVNGLNSGGAAEDAGIKIGDVITKIEDTSIKNVPELQEQVGKFRPGDKINVSLIREDKELVLPVTLKNKDGNTSFIKKEEKEITSIQSLGASFETLTPDELKKMGISNGLRITKLSNGKLAAAGIKQGFIIMSIDRKKVSSVQELNDYLQDKAGGVLIEGVYPNGVKAYYGFGL